MIEQRPPRVSARRHLLAALLFSLLAMGAALAAPVPALAQPPAQDGSMLYLPEIMNQACKVNLTPNLMGTQIYEGTGSSNIFHQPLVNSGATWVRVSISWAAVEPTNTTPDQYHWVNADSQVVMAYERCWPIVLTIGSNPAWASTHKEGFLDKTGPDELAQFTAALAERYDGDGIQDAPGSPKVLYFEMYNEPDVGALSLDERWGDAPAQYAAMLKAVYPAVKAANSKAQVVFGGIAFDFFTDQDSLHPENNGPFVRAFFENVLKNGAGPYFDIMNYHFYPLFGPNWAKNFPKDGPGLVEKTEAVRAIMRRYNISKPVIITEAGWHNNNTIPFGDDTLQVRYVQKLYTQALASDVPMLAWWPFSDVGGSYTYNSGLVTVDGSTLKPAYYAYGVFAREMAGVTFVAEIEASEDVKVYKFYDNAKQRTIFVAWTNPTELSSAFGTALVPYEDTTRSTTITLTGDAATSYDAFWKTVAYTTDGADGKTDRRLKVAINGDPKYIVVEGN